MKRKNRVPRVSGRMHKRPGIERLHTFRSRIWNMTSYIDGRIIVILQSGKCYISNKKHARWNLIKPFAAKE